MIELAIVALAAVASLREESAVTPVLGLIAGQVEVPTGLEPGKVVELAARAEPVALLKRHAAERVDYQYPGEVYPILYLIQITAERTTVQSVIWITSAYQEHNTAGRVKQT